MNELISLSILLAIATVIGLVTIRLFYSIYKSYLLSMQYHSTHGVVDIWDIKKSESQENTQASSSSESDA